MKKPFLCTEAGTGFSTFNHFDFLRDYVNPLFAMNQKFINDYNARSINYNDYTLNNNIQSIFDKSLYASQNTKGLYSMVEDEKTLREIRYIGKLLFTIRFYLGTICAAVLPVINPQNILPTQQSVWRFSLINKSGCQEIRLR
jgi:hypothetical protein